MWFKSKQNYQDEIRSLDTTKQLAKIEIDGLLARRDSTKEELITLYYQIGTYERQSDELQKQISDMQYKLGNLNTEYLALFEKKIALLEVKGR